MLKRNVCQLAIYEIDKDMESIPIQCLHQLFLEKTSEIVYITKNNKLYGIVCMGEALNLDNNGEAHINKEFKKVSEYDGMAAREIFRKNHKVNKIPILNRDGELLGDYSRWDDMCFIARCHKNLMNKEAVKAILNLYDSVYVIEPVDCECPEYLCLLKHFDDIQVKYAVLDKMQFGEKLAEKSICIFLNEDERRGVQCLYHLVPQPYNEQGFNTFRYDKLENVCWKVRLATYKSLLMQLMQEKQLERLKIRKPQDMPYEWLDDKAEVILSALQEKGIKCFCMSGEDLDVTDYWKGFRQKTAKRLQDNPISMKTPWSKGMDDAGFYAELLQLEDYQNEKAQREIFDSNICYEYKRNVSGKYFNAQNGHRITCFQPEQYVGTIYLLGLCIIVGRHVEDQYTIESYLQKQLLERGYHYRVENYGFESRIDAGIDVRLAEIDKCSSNDIVIYLSGLGKTASIEGESIEKIFERYMVPDEWVMDMYSHCNHRANECIAKGMLEMIAPYLKCNQLDGSKEVIKIQIWDTMKDYVQRKYLSQYFHEFCKEKYNSVGAVIIKGDPFSSGHRYLIEQAIKQVDYLIIFVVEEDIFTFSFEERFQMVVEGTKDFSNVLVVPNGDFVFSRKTYWEYYRERQKEVAILNAEYDINVFADYIAKPLHITHRFVGQESKKRMVNVYNDVLKEKLSEKGIQYVEIPMMSIGDEVVNTAKIRRYLKNKENDAAFEQIPETTKLCLAQ